MAVAKESLPSVTIAGVVAIVFGLFGALGSLLGAVSFLVMPQLPARPGAPAMPQGVQVMSAAMMFFFFAVAVFGIFVGVGVLRRRNWARISILIWGGLMALFCLAAVAFSLVIFSIMPSPNLPNASSADARNVMQFIRLFLVIFYGIPAGVGIWWLVLFTRKRVSDAFTAPATSTPSLDASGFPQIADAAPPQPKRPSCPLPLAFVAGLFIFSAVFTPLFLLVPSPYPMPFYFFGHISFGTEAKAILAAMAVILGVAGVGIIKLKPWALHSALVVQGVFFANGLLAIISPTFRQDIRDAVEKMSGQFSQFPGGNPFLSGGLMQSFMVFGLVFGFIVIALLVLLRSRFLQQAEAAAAART